MANYNHIQELLAYKGIDLRSSELNRPRGFASDGSKNWMGSSQSGIRHRFGSKILSKNFGKTGMTVFKTTSMTGVSKTEIIVFGSDTLNNSLIPYIFQRAAFTLTNSHASQAATVSHYYDTATSQFRFKIVRGGSTLLDQALGSGTEGSPYMLSSLETAVDALTSFSMSTPTAASTTPAAFTELIADQTVAAAGGTLSVYYYGFNNISSDLTATVYSNLKNAMLEVGSSSMRNISAVTLRNVLYCAPGNTTGAAVAGGTSIATAVISKYDGQDFYRAGIADARGAVYNGNVANGTSQTDAKGTRTVSGGALNGKTYNFGATIIRIDKAGNRVETELSVLSTALSSMTDNVVHVLASEVATLTSGANGYGYRSAKVNGAQTGVLNFAVDAGHNITAGSILYFWDNNQSRFIQREATVIGATSFDVSGVSLDNDPNSPNYDAGGSVNLLDNAIITNNFRVGFWRTKDGGSEYYLMDERPLWVTSGNHQIEYFTVADADLGAQYVASDYPRDAPPQGRYLASFNDQLIVSGNDKRANVVFFSDEGPEYFPKNSHEFELKGKASGQKQSGQVLVCGSENGLEVVSGDLLNFNFRVESVGSNIGVASHESMQEIMEGVLAFASYKGPYVLSNGRDLRPLGEMKLPDGSIASRLEPYFVRRYGPTEEKPLLERAIAAVLPNDSLYVLFIPHEDPALPGFATSNSTTWVYDFARDAWYKWTGLNMAGGMAVMDNDLYWTSRAYDGSGGPTYSDITTYLYQLQTRKGKYNTADHDQSIPFAHKCHWEHMGRPGLFKRFLRCKIYSHETRESSSCPLTVDTYVDFDTSSLSFTTLLDLASLKSITTKVKGEICRAMQFCFSQTGEYYKPVQISGHEIEAVANFRPEFKE
jgi:hypothetical protein